MSNNNYSEWEKQYSHKKPSKLWQNKRIEKPKVISAQKINLRNERRKKQ